MSLCRLRSVFKFCLALHLLDPQLCVYGVGVDYFVRYPFLLHEGEGVDNGKELTDVVRALEWPVMEDSGTCLQVNALVLHRSRIA